MCVFMPHAMLCVSVCMCVRAYVRRLCVPVRVCVCVRGLVFGLSACASQCACVCVCVACVCVCVCDV